MHLVYWGKHYCNCGVEFQCSLALAYTRSVCVCFNRAIAVGVDEEVRPLNLSVVLFVNMPSCDTIRRDLMVAQSKPSTTKINSRWIWHSGPWLD